MALIEKSRRLKKQLTLINVYAIVVGATLGDGLFLLPGLAAAQAGPAVILCYLVAAIPLIPAMFSVIELSTAMPRAGGVYYFIDRSMHPLIGTIGGMGTWLALILKISFALIGMGAYIKIFFPDIPITLLAGCLAIFFGLINLSEAQKSGFVQVLMVFGLLACIGWFIGAGYSHIEPLYFNNFFHGGAETFLGTAGLVYVSYIGITKVASVSEEIKDPEKNLPLGIILAMGTVVIVYALGTFIIVGALPPEKLYGSLTAVADAASILAGSTGVKIMAAAALLAFLSIANAGILSASRYPLAMSRDHLMPDYFSSFNKKGIPAHGIYITVALILLILFIFDPIKIAKLAGSFQLLMFSLVNLSVIVMRESGIESYDPGYRSPFYPWMQIFGIFSPLVLIIEMGIAPLLFTVGLIAFGTAWYFWYARDKVFRVGAMYHIFQRMGNRRSGVLDRELRGILVEKGLRDSDPFDEVIAHASVIFLSRRTTFRTTVGKACELLSEHITLSSEQLSKRFLEDTRLGITPVTHGIALPHLRVEGLKQPEMVLIQCKAGIKIGGNMVITEQEQRDKPIQAVFFLISPTDNSGLHLRILANIANHAERENFMDDWISATDETHIKELFHKDKYTLSIKLRARSQSSPLIGKNIGVLELPDNCLIAYIHRFDKTIIPRGGTKLKKLDRVTFIGEPKAIEELQEKYGGFKLEKKMEEKDN